MMTSSRAETRAERCRATSSERETAARPHRARTAPAPAPRPGQDHVSSPRPCILSHFLLRILNLMRASRQQVCFSKARNLWWHFVGINFGNTADWTTFVFLAYFDLKFMKNRFRSQLHFIWGAAMLNIHVTRKVWLD